MPRVPVRPPPRFLDAGDNAYVGETLRARPSAYVLQFSTVVEGLDGHVESVYVCARATHTQVTDLFLHASDEIVATRRLEHHPILSELDELRCLRDHLERVEAWLVSCGYPLRLQLDPAAAAARS